jgi:acetyl-CoA carboxylase carboxyl transferase subunit beta
MKQGNVRTEAKPETKKGEHHHFFHRKSLRHTTPVREVDNEVGKLWIKCPKCNELAYRKEYEKNFKVCQKCKHHSRLRWNERLANILDEGSWVELNAHLKTGDPLHFANDGEVYPDKIAQTRQKAGINESLVTGYGTVEGMPLAIAVADFAFLGASMGSVFGEKLVRLIEFCIERRMPLLTVSASGGARMHEGILSLMQMAKTTAALARLGEARLPHFSLLTDPCYGGVTASYAMVADVIMAEPGAMIGFAGPRVIEQTTRQKLPAGFQTAEFLQEHGMLDRVVSRREIRSTLSCLLKLYGRAQTSSQTSGTLLFFPVLNGYKNEESKKYAW